MKNIYKLIKLNKAIRSHRVKFASILLAHTFRARHLFLRFDPVMACNLRCRMCHFSNPEYSRNAKGIFTQKEIERIAELFFPSTMQLVIGCATEPSLFPNSPEIVKLAKSYGIPYVGYTSNGILLTEENIAKFIDYGLDELTLSVHGTTTEGYEHFMTGSSFATFHSMLDAFDRIRKSRNSTLPSLRINYTVNADNLMELEQFFDVFGKYSIQTLQIRPIIDFHGEYRSLLTEETLNNYARIINVLSGECKRRGITLLANTIDPTYHEDNFNSVILQAVRRHITPMAVWRTDFRWKEETYREYCKRTNWTGFLAKSVMSSREDVVKNNSGHWGKHAALYDVNL